MSNVGKDSASQLPLPGMPSEPAQDWVWTEEGTEDMESLAFSHTTVMKAEVVAALAPDSREGGVYVDATLGGGGHTEAILEASETTRVIAIDRDTVALDAARVRLARFAGRVTFVHATFGDLKNAIGEAGLEVVSGICADLGVSSPQLDEASRGLSFRREGPLDMRMDQTSGETALELIARMGDSELADVIFRFGDERRSRRIARSIKRAFGDNELQTTLDLRRAIVRAVGPVRVGGVDPATRTFQALRIAVNRELDELDQLLASLDEVLEEGGVAAMISFHSLEDRAIKHAMQHRPGFTPLTKKPVYPSEEELAVNTRSRSAKLRAYRRTSEEEDE
jgi:16S rRNA (cytosine1402-N4)-methyltransferase